MRSTTIVLAASLLAAGPAAAQERGIYVGASGGYSRVDIDKGEINQAARAAGFASASTSADESDWGAFKVYAGFQFNRNFALEFGYADLGEASTTTRTTGPAARVNGDWEADAWTLDAVGTLPLNDRFSLFGRLGTARYDLDARGVGLVGGTTVTRVRESDKGWTWKAGLGAQYNFSPNLAARLEWERYDELGNSDTGKSDVNVFGLGLRLSF